MIDQHEEPPEQHNPLPDIPAYDNEWIKFMAQLAKNESMTDIKDFIESVHWSRRQRNVIVYYARILLGRGLATTNFRNDKDYRMAMDDKSIIQSTLTVGMTRFDLTPEFNILLGMLDLHFGIESRRSKGGWWTQRIGAQRQEIVTEEKQREKTGFKDMIKERFGSGE